MTVRLEAVVEAQAIELRRLAAIVEAQGTALAELQRLAEVVTSLAGRLELAAQWAIRVDGVLDDLGAEVDCINRLAMDLNDWHPALAAALPTFARAHPFDPIEHAVRLSEAAAQAAEASGPPKVGPFAHDWTCGPLGFASAAASANDGDGASANASAGSEAEHGRQPG